MENEEIEKLKEAAFMIVEMHRNCENGPIYSRDEWQAAIAAVEAFRPKVVPLEKWVMLNQYGGFESIWNADPSDLAKDEAKRKGWSIHHLREVTPALEWERWVNYEGQNIIKQGDAILYRHRHLGELCEAHNREMQRVTGTEGK